MLHDSLQEKNVPDATADRGMLSVLIPVYNERAYLRRSVQQVLAAPLPEGISRELILVNDASTDGSDELVDQLAQSHPETIRAFHQERNQGKGAAIRRAIREMRGQYAIFQDADLEYDPSEYGLLLRPMLEGKADVVYGSRFAASPMRRVLNYHHTLGNLLLTHLSNLCTGLFLTDMETCYKLFRADVLKTIPLRSNRFGIEPEITAKIAKRGCVVYEVPISYHGRSYIEGKKIGWRDAVQALGVILTYRFIDDCYDETLGEALLRDLSRSHQLQQWLVDVLRPEMGSRILELGAGFGSVSRFLPKREILTLTDPDDANVQLLQDSFRHNDLVQVQRLSIEEDADVPEPHDTVVCLNVLERIEDDAAALRRMADLLLPGGRLILQVPHHEWLHGSYDRHLGYRRRYSRNGLRKRLEAAGFDVVRMQDFNSLGALGWWINSCLLKRDRIGKMQRKFFDTLVPLQRLLESAAVTPGLSLLCVARRRSTQ